MSETIDLNKFFEGNPKVLEAYVKSTTKLLNVLEKLQKVVDENDKEFTDYQKTVENATDASEDNVKAVNDAIAGFSKLADRYKEADALAKQTTATKKKLTELTREEAKLTVENAQAVNNLRKELKAEIATEKEQIGSLDQLRRQLRDSIKLFDQMGAEQRDATKSGKALQRNIKQLRTEVSKLEQSTGRFNRNVGNYTNGIKGAIESTTGFSFAVGGLQLALVAVGALIGSVIKTFRAFEDQNAKLKGVLGDKGTTEAIEDLNKAALDLGKTTAFTATNVAELQTEFAKLGFSVPEILRATEATLTLAVATGQTLGDAAATVGVSLRAFSLSASQTQRVVDLMAKSFSSSALDVVKWREAVKFVAPVATEAGISIEETAAALGVLADAGISGSNAGTALRRIFGELADSGKPAAEALKDLAKEGLNLADANDEVGRSAQTALVILTKNIEKYGQLNESFKDTAGSAKRLSEEQLKTLTGQITLLTSAWEGFLLSLDKGDGIIATTTRGLVSLARGFLDFLSLTGANSEIFIDGFRGASNEAIRTYAELRNLGNGETFSDLFEKTFGNQSNIDFANNVIENYQKFSDVIKENNLNAKIGARVWSIYAEERIQAAKGDEAANEAARTYDDLLKSNTANQTKNNEALDRAKKLAQDLLDIRRDLSVTLGTTANEAPDSSILDRPESAFLGVQDDGNGFFELLGINRDLFFSDMEDLENADQTFTALADKQFEQQQERDKEAERLLQNKLARDSQEILSEALKAESFEDATKIVLSSIKQRIVAFLSEAIANQIKESANIPFPASAVLAGAAVAAFTALASRVPKFKTGTNYSPEGLAMVNEAGREAYLTQKGELGLLGSGKGGGEFVNLDRGTKIFPAHSQITDLVSSLFSGKKVDEVSLNSLVSAQNSNNNSLTKNDLNNFIRANKAAIETALKKQKNTVIVPTKRGFVSMHNQSNKRVENMMKENNWS